MEYFNSIASLLSLELVSHVMLLVLCGSLATRIFAICPDGIGRNIHVPHLVFGACMLYAMSIILSFFVDKGVPSYRAFLSLYLIGIYAAYGILFWVSRSLHQNKWTMFYYVIAFLFAIIYTAIGTWQFSSGSNELFSYYVVSEVLGTIFLFIFVHDFLAQQEQLHEYAAKK